MRKSARLQSSSSASLSTLIQELVDDEEDDEVFDLSNSNEIDDDLEAMDPDDSSVLLDKKGASKRMQRKVQSSDSETEESNSETESYDGKINPVKVSSSRLKPRSKRIGTYVPPLENSSGIDGRLLSSRNEWKRFLKSQNELIKRKNRLFRTEICSNSSIIVNQIDGISYCTIRFIQDDLLDAKLTISVKSESESKTIIKEDIYSGNGKTALVNTGKPVISICFCQCELCCSSTSEFLIFVSSSSEISVFSVAASSSAGIESLKRIGRISFPSEQVFKSMCAVGRALSICTDTNVYFVNCDSFHTQSKKKFNCQLNTPSGPLFIDHRMSISTHSWRGNHIAIGTSLGEVCVFDLSMKEIFRIALPADCKINSLDWSDQFIILIGGNFSKVFSIDLRDPFVIETEVSSLSLFPKVIWSPSHSSIIFSDCENHARLLNKSVEPGNRLHHPIGTFDSMVIDIGVSPNHNIIATASASGSIQISWVPLDAEQGVEFEKRILSLKQEDNDSDNDSLQIIQVSPAAFTSQKQDTIQIYPSMQACTSVSWCPNENFPGVLAGGFRSGLLILSATDRFFI